MNNNHVGIVTFQESNNFGALLQAYALKKTIEDMGYHAEVINYHSISKASQYSCWSTERSLPVNLNIFFSSWIQKRNNKSFELFRNEILNLSSEIYDYNTIKEIEPLYDKFVCGSDQVWNPESIRGDGTFFLDFVNDPRKRVSYAASVGTRSIKDDYIDFFKSGVKRFEKLSVRENSAAELIAGMTGQKAEVVLDPTLLVSAEHWEKLANSQFFSKRYILLYMVGYTPAAVKAARSFAAKKGIDVLIPVKTIRDFKDGFKYFYGGPIEFLSAVRNAEYVVTTSFHGMMFSLIFQKNFICVDKPPKKNEKASRIDDFLSMVGLEDRKYRGDISMIDNPVNYDKVECKVESYKKKSLEYLSSCLRGDI